MTKITTMPAVASGCSSGPRTVPSVPSGEVDVCTSSTGTGVCATGGGKAAITGDFVLIGKEVNPVIQALRQNGIEVTALHNHMLDDQPHTYYVHFWANDDATKLAQGLRAALDKVNTAKS